jgi:hypothetical protein
VELWQVQEGESKDMMGFDPEIEKLKMRTQLKYMENFSRMFGPDFDKKVQMARVALREMQKIDPNVMTVAMTMTGCEGFMELVDKQEEIMIEIAKNLK